MSYVADNFPSPILIAREASESETPDTVNKFLGIARAHGWSAIVTVAEGFMPHSVTGEPVRERIRVALERDDENADAKAHEYRETGNLLQIRSFALRAGKNGERLAAVWHYKANKQMKRTTDSKKGLWVKGDVYYADKCDLDMAMLKSGKMFRNVTALKAFLEQS